MVLDFKHEVILENDRVKLTPLQPSDFELLKTYSLNEPELWKYSLTAGNGEENLRNYIDMALNSRGMNISYPFLVFDKIKNKVAGSTRFYDYQSAHQTIQLGYTWYGKEFHGTGLNQQCKFLMLQLAFEEWKLERVEFRADNNNKRSIAAMKKIGCKEEGVLRQNCAAPDGSRRDSIVLSILKDEWFDGVRDRLVTK
jgi:RimJ/RimL family protein N-acetyltransferase